MRLLCSDDLSFRLVPQVIRGASDELKGFLMEASGVAGATLRSHWVGEGMYEIWYTCITASRYWLEVADRPASPPPRAFGGFTPC